MDRLDKAALARLPLAIARPRHAAPPAIGIVHFGPGAFHRAHQAAYVDMVLEADPCWGIAAVALRSRGTIDALAAQQGLYTLAVRDAEPGFRVIGAHGRFLGPGDGAHTLALLADPAIALVTMTVTEKGYCLAPDGTLDFTHPDIVADLVGAAPVSVVGWLVAGLAARRAAGVVPFVAMPCDNVADNGAKLKAALIAFAGARDRPLADWIAGEARVPGTMVDAITPASDAALHADVAAALGVRDEACVQREAFAQWVIEDVGPFGPDLAGAGAILTSDVAGHERAKLRILNAAHSALAYAGLLRGHESVADAIGDGALADFIAAMIAEDILPVLAPVAGLDMAAYVRTVLTRFANPAIVHRLDQIAQDGSVKLPYRLAETITANRARGRVPGRAAAALGCWVAFVMRRARSGRTIADPAAQDLARLAAEGDARAVATRLAQAGIGLAAAWAGDTVLLDAIARAAEAALDGDWSALLGTRP